MPPSIQESDRQVGTLLGRRTLLSLNIKAQDRAIHKLLSSNSVNCKVIDEKMDYMAEVMKQYLETIHSLNVLMKERDKQEKVE